MERTPNRRRRGRRRWLRAALGLAGWGLLGLGALSAQTPMSFLFPPPPPPPSPDAWQYPFLNGVPRSAQPAPAAPAAQPAPDAPAPLPALSTAGPPPQPERPAAVRTAPPRPAGPA